MRDDLLSLATNRAEREFAAEAVAFLDARLSRRRTEEVDWGVGPENLALFHETTDAQERAEADAARQWQRCRWDAGFGWITGPVEYGGRGQGAPFDRLYRMIEAAYDAPDMNPIRIGLGTVGPTIVTFGTADQISQYAAALQRGDLIACQLFSEPEAGSDLAGVRTRGVRTDDGWRVSGQKVWTSNAQFADVGLALVRTDPDAPKHRGLTMFLVPMSAAGVDVRPLRQLTGGSSFTEVFLTDVALDDSLRLGAEGAGWKITTTALAGERRAVGDRSHELTARALELLKTLAVRHDRMQDPLVRDAWAQLYSRLRIARFQQQRIQRIPDDQLTGAERAIDKLLLAANFRTIGELAGQILGPAFVADTGEWGTFGWTKWMLGAMGYCIAGGTDEVLKTMLAERVLTLPREPR